ncbi:MAG: helix-turn-helix domain-containing protein [Lachnospiraceae bacterium]|nr:helix-turn-helix domain-containing protein [Lachnospiraceae bacterium]
MDEAEQKKRVEAYCIRLVKNLKERRKSLKITQAELSEKAGLSLSTVARTESMKNVPDLYTLIKLESALDEEYDRLDYSSKMSLIMHTIVDLDVRQLFMINDYINSCIKIRTEKELSAKDPGSKKGDS